jgi:hypothetical protein
MERRAEERVAVSKPVQITVLGETPEVVPAMLMNLSGRGMRLVSERAVPQDAAIRFDLDNRMLLGEVCYCVRQGTGYAIGIELQHSLNDLTGLGSLMEQITGERVPERVPVER